MSQLGISVQHESGHPPSPPPGRSVPPALPPPLRSAGGFFVPNSSQQFSSSARFTRMPRPKLPVTERRDQPINALVTKLERDAVDRVAAQLDMSRSKAARYLMNLGLAHFPFTPSEENES